MRDAMKLYPCAVYLSIDDDGAARRRRRRLSSVCRPEVGDDAKVPGGFLCGATWHIYTRHVPYLSQTKDIRGTRPWRDIESVYDVSQP